jgi:hypothetical protein
MIRIRQNRSMLKNIKSSHFRKSESPDNSGIGIEKEPVDQSIIENFGTKTKRRNRIESIKIWIIFMVLIIILLISFIL